MAIGDKCVTELRRPSRLTHNAAAGAALRDKDFTDSKRTREKPGGEKPPGEREERRRFSYEVRKELRQRSKSLT
ncbi:hypothetical protein PT282_07165 [Bifidobacterium sp. ESL0763]|uniref:hypothetical protein n=1 Tax=Bifidobacterium sp. ESL0763 TaxID=2983227 RepID=UPI0023F69AB1|nr:hypothetical protein [Bifidobacterium sp. ESL0763]MDF7664435.1 hypothetical protein [Bifidobacterium sp. ESL0763]